MGLQDFMHSRKRVYKEEVREVVRIPYKNSGCRGLCSCTETRFFFSIPPDDTAPSERQDVHDFKFFIYILQSCGRVYIDPLKKR
jgi:hypothetical protein